MARRNTAIAALGTLTLSFALVACTGSASSEPTSEVLTETSPPSTEGGATAAPATGQGAAEAAVCTALQTWSDEMRALTDVDPATASIDDVRAQVDTIKSAWDDVKTSLEEVQAADEEAVVTAGDGLESTVDDLSTDIPIADMVSQVKAAAEPIRGAYQQMANGMGCALSDPY